MFNRSEIMKAAWVECRARRTFNGEFIFGKNGRAAFATALRKAWLDARVATGDTVAIAKAERAVSIRNQIDMLAYKSLRHDIGAMRQRLEAELGAIAG